MGHLTTIMNRVKNRLKTYNEDEKKASKDDLWLQAITNLMEYISIWKLGIDYTHQEEAEAVKLFWKYEKWLDEPHRKIIRNLGA